MAIDFTAIHYHQIRIEQNNCNKSLYKPQAPSARLSPPSTARRYTLGIEPDKQMNNAVNVYGLRIKSAELLKKSGLHNQHYTDQENHPLLEPYSPSSESCLQLSFWSASDQPSTTTAALNKLVSLLDEVQLNTFSQFVKSSKNRKNLISLPT